MNQILLVLAFVLFLIGTFIGWAGNPAPWPARFNFVSAGLAAWVLSILLSHGIR